MATTENARTRAHAEVRTAILTAARTHLARDGAAALSLRAVARDVDMVPSALYRYFDSRDAMLTALIVEAYDSLGDAADAGAGPASRAPATRWVGTAMAVRRWALDHPHEYALLYGTPVPGYVAPDATVGPGTRVSRLLVTIVHDAHEAGRIDLARAAGATTRIPREVRADLRRVADLVAPGLAAEPLLAAILAWTQLFGLLGFELFGQTRGLVTAHDVFFRTAAEHAAASIGL